MRTLFVLMTAFLATAGFAQENKPAKTEEANTVTLTAAPTSLKNPLYIVNGKEMPKEKFDKIHPDQIESIEVFKDNTAFLRYGDKGANGVIVLTLKRRK